MNSKLFRLNTNDIFKGLVLAFLTTFLPAVYQTIAGGQIPTLNELGSDGKVGLTAALAYLVKNFFSNNAGQLAAPNIPKPAPYNPNPGQ